MMYIFLWLLYVIDAEYFISVVDFFKLYTHIARVFISVQGQFETLILFSIISHLYIVVDFVWVYLVVGNHV